MLRAIIRPSDWACSVEECPPGHFMVDSQLCFKTDYLTDGKPQIFNSAGEMAYFDEQVTPVEVDWEEA